MSRSSPSTATNSPYRLTSPRMEIAAEGSTGPEGAGSATTGADGERVTGEQCAPRPSASCRVPPWTCERRGAGGPFSGGDAVDDQRERLVVGVDADRALECLERPRDACCVVGLQLEQRL